MDENVKIREVRSYQSLYETQKRHLKDFMVYLAVFLIVIISEAFNFPPKYKMLYAIGVAVLLITGYNLSQKEVRAAASANKIRTNLALLVLSVLSIVFSLILNVPQYDIFMSKEERLLREYYAYLDKNIVAQGRDVEGLDKQNARAIEYLTESDAERWKATYRHHDMATEYHKLFSNQVKHDILYIKKAENVDQNVYRVVLNVHEYVLGADDDGMSINPGDTESIIAGLKDYFKMESTAKSLRESSEGALEESIRVFLNSSNGQAFIRSTPERALLWVVGSRFKLKLREPNLNIASGGNRKQFIETRQFVVYPRERKIENYTKRSNVRRQPVRQQSVAPPPVVVRTVTAPAAAPAI